jgi:hypothetical protein
MLPPSLKNTHCTISPPQYDAHNNKARAAKEGTVWNLPISVGLMS